MRKVTILLLSVLLGFSSLFFPHQSTYASDSTPMQFVSYEFIPCSPDCATVRIYFDQHPDNSTGWGLLNWYNNQVWSGAAGPTNIHDTYADFTIYSPYVPTGPVQFVLGTWDVYSQPFTVDYSTLVSPTPTPTLTPTPTPTPTFTPMQFVSYEFVPCSPDCATVRIYFDQHPDNSTGWGLLNWYNNQVWSGAAGPTNIHDTYADFTINAPYVPTGPWQFVLGTWDVYSQPFTVDYSTLAYNTPAGNNVSYTQNGVSLTFSQVTSSGNTTITSSQTGKQPPTGFRLGSPPLYYNLSTTATFTGDIKVCMNYDETTIQGNESKLKLMHYDSASGWTNITTSLDTTQNIICGLTTSFSDFTIMTEPGIQDLITHTKELNLQQGIENSLDAKLSDAQDALTAKNNGLIQTAVSKLNAFISEVEAQRGKKLSDSQATDLHSYGNTLIKIIQGIKQF